MVTSRSYYQIWQEERKALVVIIRLSVCDKTAGAGDRVALTGPCRSAEAWSPVKQISRMPSA